MEASVEASDEEVVGDSVVDSDEASDVTSADEAVVLSDELDADEAFAAAVYSFVVADESFEASAA